MGPTGSGKTSYVLLCYYRYLFLLANIITYHRVGIDSVSRLVRKSDPVDRP